MINSWPPRTPITAWRVPETCCEVQVSSKYWQAVSHTAAAMGPEPGPWLEVGDQIRVGQLPKVGRDGS
jgi:hypothetical protein